MRALEAFTGSDEMNVLMLSSLAKASGTNLQCANHIVFMDPAGTMLVRGHELAHEDAIGSHVCLLEASVLVINAIGVRSSYRWTCLLEVSTRVTNLACLSVVGPALTLLTLNSTAPLKATHRSMVLLSSDKPLDGLSGLDSNSQLP
jgi:hypothetical protein